MLIKWDFYILCIYQKASHIGCRFGFTKIHVCSNSPFLIFKTTYNRAEYCKSIVKVVCWVITNIQYNVNMGTPCVFIHIGDNKAQVHVLSILHEAHGQCVGKDLLWCKVAANRIVQTRFWQQCIHLFLNGRAFVIPMAPIFPPYVVVACVAPTAPDRIVPNPSIIMPLFTACCGGGGTWLIDAHA